MFKTERYLVSLFEGIPVKNYNRDLVLKIINSSQFTINLQINEYQSFITNFNQVQQLLLLSSCQLMTEAQIETIQVFIKILRFTLVIKGEQNTRAIYESQKYKDFRLEILQIQHKLLILRMRILLLLLASRMHVDTHKYSQKWVLNKSTITKTCQFGSSLCESNIRILSRLFLREISMISFMDSNSCKKCIQLKIKSLNLQGIQYMQTSTRTSCQLTQA